MTHKPPRAIPPFDTLHQALEKEVFAAFEPCLFPENTLVVNQETSKITHVMVVTTGQFEYTYVKDGHPLMQGRLGPQEIFGGLSILYNDQMAVHTVRTMAPTQVLRLNARLFLRICSQTPKFKDFFCLEMGRCMLLAPFAGSIYSRQKDKQLNLPFFNQPVSAVFRPNIVTCKKDAPIHEAVRKMNRQGTSAVLVRSETHKIQGIVTDADLKTRVLAPNLSQDRPVSEITSSPLVSISSQCQVFEAFLAMIKFDKRHLAVTGNSGDICGIITEKDLILAQTRAAFLLIKSVKSAKRMDDLVNIHQRLETMLLDPISNGANPDYITGLITTFSDAIIEKVIEFALKEMEERSGPLPCKFVFITMGSEGREEQTLISDQDNAIVFEDLEDKAQAARAKVYFDQLAQGICTRLDMAGYVFCTGNNMAQNPQWCQPLSVWKGYFQKWIRAASPEDLLHSSIFFDFRPTFGDLDLAQNLTDHLQKAIGKWSGFLRNMTENTLAFKPPIGMFGKFIVETSGRYKDAMDIKYAILPIIDFARIYALKNAISQTNTLARLFRLYTRHALTAKEYTDTLQAYNFLMGLRFRRQITTILDEKGSPDNYIYPGNLSSLDQLMLKEVLKMVENLQQKLNIEFTGIA